MKINWNSKYFTIAFYALCTIVASELAILLIFNFDVVSEKLSGFAAVATPIIIWKTARSGNGRAQATEGSKPVRVCFRLLSQC